MPKGKYARGGIPKRIKNWAKDAKVVVVKKQYKRKGKKSANGDMNLYDDSMPMPLICMRKMRYASYGSLTGGTADTFGTGDLYSLNSIFDPLQGGGTASQNTSVVGLTGTMSAFYSRYQVLGVDIRVEFYDASTDGSLVGITVSNPAQTITLAGSDASAFARQPQVWIKDISTTGSQRKIFKQYFSMRKLFNWSKVQMAADNSTTTSATASGAPASQPYLRLQHANARGNSATTVLYKIELTYYTRFYDRLAVV